MSTSTIFQVFRTSLFALVLLAGCSAGRSETASLTSSGADTLSSNSSRAGDTANTPEQPVPTADPRSVEPGGFNPDGYYIVHNGLTIDGRKIGWLELSTTDIATANVSDGRRKLLQPPVAFLTVSERNSSDDARYKCAVPFVTPDSLSVRCLTTPVGEITIDGQLLGKSVDYSDKFDERETMLLVARVVINKDGQQIHNAVHRFTYNPGD